MSEIAETDNNILYDMEIYIKTVQEKAYQKGLEDAWDTAEKFITLKYTEAKDVYDATIILRKHSVLEAMKEIKVHETDALEVGDEVIDSDGNREVVTFINNCELYTMTMDGSCGLERLSDWHKTGRHFDKLAEGIKELKDFDNKM